MYYFESMFRHNAVLERFCVSLASAVRQIISTYDAAIAPMTLAQTDRHGRNIVRGKARRRLKLIASQYRRGLL